jgi:hypothetical protein
MFNIRVYFIFIPLHVSIYQDHRQVGFMNDMSLLNYEHESIFYIYQ